MAQVALKINISEKGVVKTVQFDSRTTVYDACTIIRQKMPEAANLGNRKSKFYYDRKIMFFYISAKDYGLFLMDSDPKRGVWMENAKSLEYYLVRPGVSEV